MKTQSEHISCAKFGFEEWELAKPFVKDLVLIAEGQFSNCYQAPNKNEVIIVSNCLNKAMLSEPYCPDPSYLIPTVSKLEQGVYRMPKYNTNAVTKLNKYNHKTYKELKNLACFVRYTNDYHKVLDTLDLYPYVKKVMHNYINALCNYSDKFRFEISPRNVATNTSGQLILLDVFFIPS